MFRKRLILGICLGWSVLCLAAGSGEWEITPLVRVGDQIPGSENTFLALKKHWVSGNGMVMFWAANDVKRSLMATPENPERYVFALFSATGDRINMIAEARKKFSEPDRIEKSISIDTCERCMPERWELYVLPMRDRFLLSIPARGVKGYKSARIYVWRGEKLDRLLPPVVDFVGGNRTSFISEVALTVDRDERVLVHFRRKGKPDEGLGVYDGSAFKVICQEGDSPPGMAGASIHSFLTPASSNWLSWANDHTMPAFYGDGVVVMLKVKGADYKQGLFLLASGDARPLLKVGGNHPVVEDRTIEEIFWFQGSGSANSLLMNVLSSNPKKETREELLLYHDGSFTLAYAGLMEGADRRYEAEMLRKGAFFPNQPDRFVFFSQKFAKRSEYKTLRSGFHDRHSGSTITTNRDVTAVDDLDRLCANWQIFGYRTGEIFHLGEDVNDVSQSTHARPARGDLPGIVVGGYRLPFVVDGSSGEITVPARTTVHYSFYSHTHGFADLVIKMKDEVINPNAMYVDPGDPAMELKPVPILATCEGREITHSDVLQWISDGEAIIRLDDGFYRLKRRDGDEK